MAKDIAIPESVNPDEKVTILSISKEQATDLKIDKAVRFEVVGEVKEIRQCYNDKEHYEVVLKNAEVECCDMADEADTEDAQPESKDSESEKSLATMPKDELKRIIMVKEIKE